MNQEMDKLDILLRSFILELFDMEIEEIKEFCIAFTDLVDGEANELDRVAVDIILYLADRIIKAKTLE